jgi:hypothetical protein
MKHKHHSAEPEVNAMSGSVEILTTFNQADIAIVESILGDNQIGYIVVGGNAHYDPMRVLVKRDQFEMALGLMRGLKLNFSRIAFIK